MSGPPTLGSRLYAALRVLYPILLAFLLFGTGLPGTLGIPVEWLGWVYAGLVVAFYVAPSVREYPITTVGTARSVDTRSLRGADDRECTVCGSAIATGEHREYREQWVLFGMPVRNVDWGANDYCEVCKRREQGEIPPDEPLTVEELKSDPTLQPDSTDSAETRVRERERE